eukprot:5865914-Prymnesium_polylepis.2
MPQLRYRRYHAEKAKGGLALTMFGGSSTVSPDSPAAFGQIDVSSDAVIPHFQRLADAVHLHGAATMCQLTHMGRRTSWDVEDWLPTAAPSRAFRPPAPLEPLGAVRRWPPPVRLARSAAARHREGHPARSCARPQACASPPQIRLIGTLIAQSTHCSIACIDCCIQACASPRTAPSPRSSSRVTYAASPPTLPRPRGAVRRAGSTGASCS